MPHSSKLCVNYILFNEGGGATGIFMFLPRHFISNKGKGILIVQFPGSAAVPPPRLCAGVCTGAHAHTAEGKQGERERHMRVFISHSGAEQRSRRVGTLSPPVGVGFSGYQAHTL